MAEEIILKGIESEYYEMFLPLVVSIPFIISIYADKKNNITRFQIYRTGKVRYMFGKFFAIIISGGIITVLGQLLFSVIIYNVFPKNSSEIFEVNKMLLLQESKICSYLVDNIGKSGLYIVKLIRVFLYGAFSTVLSFALSVFVKNRYMVMTIPIAIVYMWDKFINKTDNVKLHSLKPCCIGDMFYIDVDWMLPFFVVTSILAIVFYILCMERKCDCGEG